MMAKRILPLLFFCATASIAFSQADIRPLIEKGNEFYGKNDFKNAAVQYKHACMLDTTSFDAWFNFGNALYKSEKFILASEAYARAARLTNDNIKKADILHNLGNIAFEQENYAKAADLFKKSLLLNPKADDTRHNLALAQKKLDEQKNNDDNDKNKKKDDKKKPSKFAEECMKKAMELIAQNKFQDALDVMNEGLKKDETVSNYSEFIQKLTGVVTIINNNQQ